MDVILFGGTRLTILFGIIIILWVLWGLRPGFQAIRHLKVAMSRETAKRLFVKSIHAPVDNYDVPLIVLSAKTMYDAYVAQKQANEPIMYKALEDCTEQIMENFLENRYIRPITLYANLLPPIGFIGTVVGMVLVFSSGGEAMGQINTRGLGVALLSTLYALSGFVVIELIKIWIVNRASRCIDLGIRLFHDTIEKSRG